MSTADEAGVRLHLRDMAEHVFRQIRHRFKLVPTHAAIHDLLAGVRVPVARHVPLQHLLVLEPAAALVANILTLRRVSRNVRLQLSKARERVSADEADEVSALRVDHRVDLQSGGGRKRSTALLALVRTLLLNGDLLVLHNN